MLKSQVASLPREMSRTIRAEESARKTQEKTENAGLVSHGCQLQVEDRKLTALGVAEADLNAGIPALAGNQRPPDLLQGPALQIHGQHEGKVDGRHRQGEQARQDAPLAREEEETDRDLAEGGAHEIPRLAQDAELQGARRVRGGALDGAEDGACECHHLSVAETMSGPRAPAARSHHAPG